MNKNTVIGLTKKLTQGLGLDESQSKSLQYYLTKELPAVLAKNPQILSHLLYQKEPRHNAIAEQGLIGRILLTPQTVLPECTGMTKEYFYLQEYSMLFEAIQFLADNNKTVNVDVVASVLGEDKIAEYGGRHWIESLCVTGDGSKDLIDQVVKAYKLRELWKHSNQVLQDLHKCDLNDADALLEKFKAKLDIEDATRDNMSDSKSLAKLMSAEFDKTLHRIEQGIIYPGHLFPIKRMNQLTGGAENGMLIIKAARPGMGKTADAICEMLYSAMELNEVDVFFSLEMPKIKLLLRMFFIRKRVKKYDWDNGLKNNHFRNMFMDFLDEVEKSKIFIDDTPGITWRHIRDKCLKIKNKHGKIDRVFIDYLQLMSSIEGQNREQQISAISRNLKGLAKELDCPITALSQLSRAVESRGGSKRPQLSDLRESGAIEQDADIVEFLYRPEYYDFYEDDDGTSLRGVLEKIIAKNREGALESLKVFFDAEYTAIRELDERPDGYINETHKAKMRQENGFTEINDDPFLPEI